MANYRVSEKFKGICYCICGLQPIILTDSEYVKGFRIFYFDGKKVDSVDVGCDAPPALFGKDKNNICTTVLNDANLFNNSLFTFEIKKVIIYCETDTSGVSKCKFVTFDTQYPYIKTKNVYAPDFTQGSCTSETKKQHGSVVHDITFVTDDQGIVTQINIVWRPANLVDCIKVLISDYVWLSHEYQVNYMMEGRLKAKIHEIYANMADGLNCVKIQNEYMQIFSTPSTPSMTTNTIKQKLIHAMACLIILQCCLRNKCAVDMPEFKKEGTSYGYQYNFDLQGVFPTNYGVVIIKKNLWWKQEILFGEEFITDFQFIHGNLRGVGDYLQALQKTAGTALHDNYNDDKIKFMLCYGRKDLVPKYATTSLQDDNINKFVYDFFPLEQAEEQKFQTIVDTAIAQAAEQNADILVFPELFAYNDIMQNYLINKLNEASREGANPKLMARLTVAGSYMANLGVSGMRNRMPVLYRKTDDTWEVLVNYDKSTPFIARNSASTTGYYVAAENIQSGDSVAVIKAGVLNIGFAICRDALDLLNPANPIRSCSNYVDLLIVSADNAGCTNLFVAAGETLSRWHKCGMVMTNSVSAIKESAEKYNEVALAIYPCMKSNIFSSGSGEILYIKNPFMQSADSDESDEHADQLAKIFQNQGLVYSQVQPETVCKIMTIDAKRT